MYMKYMNMDSFEEKIHDIYTIIIPMGMIEAHGHHCPLATDILIPNKFCEITEDKIGNKVIIAPEINYGHSWALSVYPGTINVSIEAFINYVRDISLEFIRNGFKNSLPRLHLVSGAMFTYHLKSKSFLKQLFILIIVTLSS